jgi:O-antigen/teichoic acid export membrane protein
MKSYFQFNYKELVIRHKRQFKDFFIYSFGTLLLGLVSFFMMKYYTQLLSPKDYGQMELINNFTTIQYYLLNLGLAAVVTIEYYHLDNSGRKLMFNNLVSTYILLVLPGYILSSLVAFFFSNSLFGKVSFLILLIAPIIGFLNFFQSILLITLTLSKRALAYSFIKFVSGILGICLTIFFVLYFKLGILGFFCANLVAISSVCLFGLNEYKKRVGFFRFCFDKKVIRNFLRLSTPFIWGSVSVWLLSGIDRWLIKIVLGEHEVGLYAVAWKFPAIYSELLIAPALGVYYPFVYERFAKGEFKLYLRNIFVITIIIFSVLALITPLIASLIIDTKFNDALRFMPFLVIGHGFYFLTQVLFAFFIYHKKSMVINFTFIISGVVNIITAFVFLKMWGTIGASFAFSCGNFAAFLFLLIFRRNFQKHKVSLI